MEQEKIKLDSKYIPERYPEPSIIWQYICRGNPEAVPAFCSSVHLIKYTFKDSKKQDKTRKQHKNFEHPEITWIDWEE